MNRLIIIFLLLFIINCDLPENPVQNTMPILSNIFADYYSDTLYLAYGINEYNQADSIITKIYLDTENMFEDTITLTLNDYGTNGDILPYDGIFSKKEHISDFQYGNYFINTALSYNNQIIWEGYDSYLFEENHPTEIIDIEFWKYYNNTNGYMIDYKNDKAYNVDDDLYSYLYFKIILKDLNGSDDIKYVKFEINVENMAAEDSCNYTPTIGYQQYSEWYMNIISYNDSLLTYDLINEYSDNQLGFQVRPIDECGRTGLTSFKFIVSDKENNITTEEVFLLFSKCGENYWNCDQEDCESCLEECECYE